ncbi:MAG: hypothetical protein ACERKO_10470 [Acetanaerobacterium sp.]
MSIGAEHAADFFLGATTPQGFISCYQQSYNIDEYEYICILKGGPCKHEFIQSVALELRGYDEHTELIHSSLDPTCCDGVIFHTLRAAVIDGGAPHVLEPRYYDAFETILSLDDCCDKDYIRAHRTEILSLTDKNARLYERCVRFVCAAGSLVGDTYSLALACTDEEKIDTFCARTLSREIKENRHRSAKERHRFLSAVTPDGITLFNETISHYCSRLYLIEDEFGAASNLILQRLRTGIAESGYDVICCWCPLSPFEKLEHILVPELGLGFVTSNKSHPLEFEDVRTLHARRFTSLEALAVRRQRISFNRRATAELIDAAAIVMRQSKEHSKELKRIYLDAVDEEKMKQTVHTTVQSILAAGHSA